MYTSPHHGDRPFRTSASQCGTLRKASATTVHLSHLTYFPYAHPHTTPHAASAPHTTLPPFLPKPTPAALLCQQLQLSASDCTLVHADIAICSTTGANAYFFCLAPAPAHTLRTLSTQAGRGASGNTKEHQGAHSSARDTFCEAHALKPAPHNPQYPNTTKGKALHQQPVISALQTHASLARLLLACLSKSRAT